MEKTLWQKILHDYMQEISEIASNLKSIMSKYPCEKDGKPDRKRMRAEIKEVLADYSTPDLKRLTDLLRKLPSFENRANELNGKDWLSNSISVWDDIRKSAEERKLKHPAMFPAALAKRLIECFTNDSQDIILDPFAGVGSTLIAAKELNKDAIGVELSQDFAEIAINRIENIGQQLSLFDDVESNIDVYVGDSRDLQKYVKPNSVDMVVTSPPYWDILLEKRPLYPKENANYGDTKEDLGKISDYQDFLAELKTVFEQVYQVMKIDSYCCIVLRDLYKGKDFYPFHIDTSQFMQDIGFTLISMFIWDRRLDYNYRTTLGYPSTFYINTIHEFILIFRK